MFSGWVQDILELRADMAMFDRFPYDVLQLIFNYADVKTLLNAALTGRALNEIASFSLYTSITFNPDAELGVWYYGNMARLHNTRNPIDALQRRPQLRRAVRKVILYNSRLHQDYELFQKHTQECYQALLQLPNVSCLRINSSPATEYESLAKVVKQIDSLQTLGLWEVHWPMDTFPDTTAQHIHAELTNEAVITLRAASVAHKVRTLAANYEIYEMTALELCQELSSFTGLTRLFIDKYLHLSPSEVCRLVAAVPSLQEARLYCKLDMEDHPMVRTNATNLTYLRIRITEDHYRKNIEILKRLVKLVAGQCRLKRLDLVAATTKPTFVNGDPLLQDILSTHENTLEKLKLPKFHILPANLGDLLARCERLAVLWLGMTPESKRLLPSLLARSTSLQKLRIYTEGTWERAFADTLLHQTCGALREFKVRAQYGREEMKLDWKAYWEYDTFLESATLRVHGPDTGVFNGFLPNEEYQPEHTSEASEPSVEYIDWD